MQDVFATGLSEACLLVVTIFLRFEVLRHYLVLEADEKTDGLGPGAIAGIVIGVLVFIVIVVVLVYWCKFRESKLHLGV